MARLRSVARVILTVGAGILLPVGLVASWADTTVYDSASFADRSVALLDSAEVRREVARRLTEELARSGNQQAVNFRPAMQLAVEAAVDTDTFRSIFRTAVRRTHESLLEGQGGQAGLDLSDSVAIITSTLRVQGGEASGEPGGQLGSSLTDVTDRLSRYRVFDLDQIAAAVAVGALLASLACAVGALALAEDRRRAVRTLGWVAVADGVLVVLLVVLAGWIGGRLVADPGLAAAVRGAIRSGMADLRTLGFGVTAYGLIVVAATTGARHTPARVWASLTSWVERRRTRRAGKVFLGGLAVTASLALLTAPSFWLQAALAGGALWLGYLGVTELLEVIRRPAAAEGDDAATPHRWRELLAVGGVVLVVVAVVSAGLLVTTRRAAHRAAAAGELRCNGQADLCDRRLDQVTLPGSHNAMSSALYPGWLFAEQVSTIRGQLDAGVRALLVDTHYGIPSSSKMPGSESAIVLTDRASELANPAAERADPELAARAAALAARAPAAAGAQRGIYLCHNFCELGAVPFADVLTDVRAFMDEHPDEVVSLVIQDATSPADTADAIVRAGLGDRVATLDPSKPLPTLRSLVESGRTLLVFAEQGGTGAPAWYQPAYEHWFQETPYTFADASAFTCAPNRGPADAPLFLVNHWVAASPPNPGKAAAVNDAKVLGARLQQCAAERGRVPNIVAVDFAARGRVAKTVAGLGDTLRGAARRGGTADWSTSGTTSPATTVATSTPESAPFETIPEQTKLERLTGGDPARFCDAIPSFAAVLAPWAAAGLSSPEDRLGEADLVFGPLLAQRAAAYIDSAPVELAELAQPLLERARAATEALSGLGLETSAQQALVDDVALALVNTSGEDSLTIMEAAADRLDEQVAGRLGAAGRAFYRSAGDLTAVLDLGEVSDDVAAAAGFACATTG